MAPPTLPEEQLLELLIQLQKTTPEQARGILSAQPQIAYALMTLMIKLNVVNLEVLQKTLASATVQPPLGAGQLVTQAAVPPSAPAAHQIQQQYRAAAPQIPPVALAQAPTAPVYSGYTNGHAPAPGLPYNTPAHGYGGPASAPAAMMPDPMANIPDEQKAMIMRVIAMTPDQINRLPPNERATLIQLRATLGYATD